MSDKPGLSGIPEKLWMSKYGEKGRVPNTRTDLDELTDLFFEMRRQMQLGNGCAISMHTGMARLLEQAMAEVPEYRLMDRALARASRKSAYDHALAILMHGRLTHDWTVALAQFWNLYDAIPTVERFTGPAKLQARQSDALIAVLGHAREIGDHDAMEEIAGRMERMMEECGFQPFGDSIGYVTTVLGPKIRAHRYYNLEAPHRKRLVELGEMVYAMNYGGSPLPEGEERIKAIFAHTIPGESFERGTITRAELVAADLCGLIGRASIPALKQKLDSYAGQWYENGKEMFGSSGLYLVGKLVTLFPQDFEAEARRWLAAMEEERIRFCSDEHEWSDVAAAEIYSQYGGERLKERVNNVVEFGTYIDSAAYDRIRLHLIKGLLREGMVTAARLAVHRLHGYDHVILALQLITSASRNKSSK